jgi:hypothetical protein
MNAWSARSMPGWLVATYKATLAVLGLGALLAMGAFGHQDAAPSGDVGTQTVLAAPPQITLGSTRTQSIPPSKPPTPIAKPPVRALPAAGTLPGN